MSEDAPHLLQLVERMAKMEGLLMGVQASISQSQAQSSAFMSRVERLEARQVELERQMVTREDLALLTASVDALKTSDARQQGGTAVASWSASALGSWAAVVISLLALIGIGVREQVSPSTAPAQHGSR